MTRQERLRRILCFFGLHRDYYRSRLRSGAMVCPHCGCSWLDFRNIFRNGGD